MGVTGPTVVDRATVCAPGCCGAVWRLHLGFRLAGTLPCMRRWIVLLLMVVLPLQLGWAAAANLCLDEPSTQAPHFGHHLHAEAEADDAVTTDAAVSAQAAEAADAHDASAPNADNDCGCSGQLCGAHLVPADLSGMPSPQRGACAAAGEQHAYRSCDGPRIERPNWPHSS